jgi:hypothetical protein
MAKGHRIVSSAPHSQQVKGSRLIPNHRIMPLFQSIHNRSPHRSASSLVASPIGLVPRCRSGRVTNNASFSIWADVVTTLTIG